MLHQVGVSFDLYYDARKHKIKIHYRAHNSPPLPDQLRPRPPILFTLTSLLILSSRQHLVLPCGLIFLIFLDPNRVYISFVPRTLHTLAPSHFPLLLSSNDACLSEPSSRKPTACVLRLNKETSSHNQVKQEVKL